MSPILARTASDIVLECDVQIPRGIPASSCLPYAPSPHDILFVPEFLLPPPQHSGEARDAERDLRTSIRPLADAAGIVVACGSDAAAAAGAPREEIAMAQAAGWSRRGKWVVCGSAISVAGAALDVIEGIFGERCRKQVVEFGEVREGVAAVRGGVRRE
ncbi:hypothetical protein M427DRAFT_283731 [Gonapodya prolifera JEL478]|uniref:Uncharacterized protein n=1 Tax=Gonapodya prolifera (strain JEL478) TaxID=1344416 RepID=A0A139AJ65_GONPJ|nr:hypothetical protein M427DRAFT_283731 [Gonapodya prolifera JEL478]|eukprot:KXS16758.1 hypothetical protein M427DRAFT_283731 [Gonapodya prolifera JEL478]